MNRQLVGRLWGVFGIGILFFEVLFCGFCVLDGMEPRTALVCEYAWPHNTLDAVLGWARPVACPIGAWMSGSPK